MKRCVYCTGRVEDGESDTCEVCQRMNRAYVDLDEILCAAVNDGAIEGLRGCDVQADYEATARWIIADFDVIHTSIPAAKPRMKVGDE